MKKHDLTSALRMAVPKASPLFGRAVHETLHDLARTDAIKEEPMTTVQSKRRTAVLVFAVILAVAIVATATTLLTGNLFDVTMGDTPENAASLTQHNLAEASIGDTKVSVKEAAYDGMALYVLCAVRDLTADEPMGTVDSVTGQRYLTEEDYDRFYQRNVLLWWDGLWIDGQYVSMPNMSVTEELPGEENGELLYYYKFRLDQSSIILDGKNVEITLPVGEPQNYETLATDPETGYLQKPDAGVITFHLDCSVSDQVTITQPEILTEGPNWSAKASQVVFSPLQLYVTLDWEIRPEVLAAYIAENGDGYYMDGEKLWDYDALEVAGSDFMDMQLVDADGTPVFETMTGFYGCGSVSNTHAWFTFPYTDAYPEPMYLAPAGENGPDMTQAVQIR